MPQRDEAGKELARLKAQLADLQAEQARRAVKFEQRLAEAWAAASNSAPAAASAVATNPEPAQPAAELLPPGTPDLAMAELEARRMQMAHDEAVTRETGRIEERGQQTRDPNELAILRRLNQKMTDLELAQEKVIQAATPEEKAVASLAAQQLMGEVIQLNQADRQYKMTALAWTMGLTNAADITHFMDQVDGIYRETHRDLAPLFSRGGPYHPSPPVPLTTNPPPVGPSAQ